MIKITNQTTSEILDVYDAQPVISMYTKLGIDSKDMESWNSFTHAVFPECSHGKFVVAADRVSSINTGKFEITLDIIDINAAVSVSFKKLMVKSVNYFEVPITAWALANPADNNAESRKIAIVELVDRSADMDDIISKDYNRITRLAPKDTANDFEPLVADLKTFEEIIDDILTDHPIGGVVIPLTLTGIPSSLKPRNVLTAGSSVKDVIKLIADAHFLVAFVDNDGNLIITNEQTTAELVPLKNSVIYSQYGPIACPSKIDIVFSENAHQQSKQRTTLLIDYTGKTDVTWASDFIEPDPTTDPTLPNVSRTPSTGNSDAFFYPFMENDEYGVINSDTEYTNLLDAFQTNYESRTLRELKVCYKDLQVIRPSSTVNKTVYRYAGMGMMTMVESFPPEKLAIPPLTNQVARGLEYVPPFLRGTVSDGGADYDPYIPGYPAFVESGDIEAELMLPTLGEDPFPVKVWQCSPTALKVGETLTAHYNIHTRRYEIALSQRRNWIGYLYASYSGVVIGFWVVPTIQLDGALPATVEWVVNIHKWNFGIAGATVTVTEDRVNNRWVGIQQEYICPDGRTIAEPPPPPPAEPPTYPE